MPASHNQFLSHSRAGFMFERHTHTIPVIGGVVLHLCPAGANAALIAPTVGEPVFKTNEGTRLFTPTPPDCMDPAG